MLECQNLSIIPSSPKVSTNTAVQNTHTKSDTLDKLLVLAANEVST
jgi:hypothetical protein